MIRNAWLNSPVTSTQLAAITNMVTNMLASLAGLPNLTKEDKQLCIKVGDPQAMFIVDIKDICVIHPTVMPGWHDLTDYYTRVGTMENLIAIERLVQGLLETVSNALVGAKSDVMVMSLDYYHALKRARKSGIPGLEKHYIAARDHFKKSTGVTPEEQYPEEEMTEGNTGSGESGGKPAA